MLAFLQQPYVFAVALAFATAVLVFLYGRVTDKEASRPTRTFFKTLAAGILAGVALTYMSSSKPEPIATEPFDAVVAGVVPGGI